MVNRLRSADLYFIVRCDGQRVAGWQVRTPKWHPHGAGSKLFSDTRYGSRELALQAAIAHRDAIFDGVQRPNPSWVHSANVTNRSGLVGISLASDRRLQRNGKTRALQTGDFYWMAYWSRSGVQTIKRFPVARYGFVRAWEMAVATREERSGIVFSEEQKARGRLLCLQQWGEILQKSV